MSWLREYFADVDAMRIDEYLARHTPEVTMRFGNQEPTRGRDALRDGLVSFWSNIEGLRHNFGSIWEIDDTTIFEHSIDYTRRDGLVVNVPCTTIFRREDELVSDIRVYIDLAPVLVS